MDDLLRLGVFGCIGARLVFVLGCRLFRCVVFVFENGSCLRLCILLLLL